MSYDVSTALGTAGAGETFEALGRTWSVLPPSQKVKSDYEARMKMEARQDLLEEEPQLTPEKFREKQRKLTAAIRGRAEYAYGGPFFKELIVTAYGSSLLFWMCLKLSHPDMTLEFAEALIEANEPEALWAFRLALHQADPLLFSPPMKPATTGTETTPEPTCPPPAAKKKEPPETTPPITTP